MLLEKPGIKFAEIFQFSNMTFLWRRSYLISLKANKLKGFEMIRGIHIENDPFTIENGLLTPTHKTKRPVLQQKYKSILEQLYE